MASGIIVGIMARYGSDKIRGHGIPEAIKAILLNGARVEPRVAILEPILRDTDGNWTADYVRLRFHATANS